jgi:hypothetical protein
LSLKSNVSCWDGQESIGTLELSGGLHLLFPPHPLRLFSARCMISGCQEKANRGCREHS